MITRDDHHASTLLWRQAAAIESGKWDELGGNMLAGIMRQKKRQQRAERKAERTKRQAESGSAAAAMASELVAVKLAAMAEPNWGGTFNTKGGGGSFILNKTRNKQNV